jgi:hypothetical protein
MATPTPETDGSGLAAGVAAGRHADVCSVPCARAAHAGENRE